MTRQEALTIIRELLAGRVAELEQYPADPEVRVPAVIRRQFRNLERWREIVAGADLTDDDLTDVLKLIEAELTNRRMAHRMATGPFSSFVDEATAIAAAEWQKIDDARLLLKLPETAAVLRY